MKHFDNNKNNIKDFTTKIIKKLYKYKLFIGHSRHTVFLTIVFNVRYTHYQHGYTQLCLLFNVSYLLIPSFIKQESRLR